MLLFHPTKLDCSNPCKAEGVTRSLMLLLHEYKNNPRICPSITVTYLLYILPKRQNVLHEVQKHPIDKITESFTPTFPAQNLFLWGNKDGKPMLETIYLRSLLHLIYLFVNFIYRRSYLHFLKVDLQI